MGFNGGQLLYLAVAGCISNDLFREARAAGIELSSLLVKVSGDFVGEPAVSDEIQYEVEVSGDVPEDRLRALIDQVDDIAEIPNSLRQGTQVRLVGAKVATPPEAICRSPSANRASLHATPFGLRFQRASADASLSA